MTDPRSFLTPLKVYTRLSGPVMARVMGLRGRDIRAVVLFRKVVILWDAPDSGRKVVFK